MKALFDYFCIRGDKGYFVEKASNLLVEYDMSENRVSRYIDVGTKGKQHHHEISNIELRGNDIILYPCWSDSIRIVDINSFEVINTISIPNANTDGLWCDYRPLLSEEFKNSTSIIMYSCRNRLEFLDVNYKTGEIKRSMLKNSTQGCGVGDMIVSGAEMFFVPYHPQEFFCIYSIDKCEIKIVNTPNVCPNSIYFKNGKVFLADADGFIFVYDKEGKQYKKINPKEEAEKYNEKKYVFFNNDDGVLVAGIYRDGSLLHLNDEYEISRVSIDGLCYEYDSQGLNWFEKINEYSSWSVNREFIQINNGVFYLGGGIKGKIFDAINISCRILGSKVLLESECNSVKEFVSEIIE